MCLIAKWYFSPFVSELVTVIKFFSAVKIVSTCKHFNVDRPLDANNYAGTAEQLNICDVVSTNEPVKP